jgi:hypothetical protein
MLTLDPSKRISGEAALEHPYLDPEMCADFDIAIGQDCHEMWAGDPFLISRLSSLVSRWLIVGS